MRMPADASPRKRLDALSFSLRVWEALDTPTSLSCALLAKYGEYKQLVEKSVDPSRYLDPHSFLRDYQAVKLLSKYPYLETGIDRELVAKKKFLWAEVQCKETNERFRLRAMGCAAFKPRVERVLSRAQRKIAQVLGDVPSLECLDFRFGPGAAFGVRGDTSVFKKIANGLECTFAMAHKLGDFLSEFPGWIREDSAQVRLVQGSELTFVPKDAKTDRPICIEPALNGLYQKGVGSFVRERLSRHGINLRDQGQNQYLASVAHRDDLATVDFTSASDTISYGLVLDLLPIDWFEFLDIARSPRYFHEGRWYNFHKFTSMGNAYTFELESLIFFALAHAVCEEVGIEPVAGLNLSVYGDDVIIPRDAFDLYQEVCSVCGFSLNGEKSFVSGLFFESCGHDYYNGHLVRPFLLKKRLTTLPSAYYTANIVRRLQKRFLDIPVVKQETPRLQLLRRLDGVHAWVVGCIPQRFRLWGPCAYGDGHLHAELDEVQPARAPRGRESWEGWWYYTIVETPRKVAVQDVPTGYALYDVVSRGNPDTNAFIRVCGFREDSAPDKGAGYSMRSRTEYRVVKQLCHDWPSYFWKRPVYWSYPGRELLNSLM